MKQIIDILREHAFFKGLPDQELEFIAGCAKNVVFKEGNIIANLGDPANEFYLIRHGQVAVSIEIPPRKPFIAQTLGENDILGFSWLIPPYQWTFSAKASQSTRAISIDGACLRKKCEENTRLGFTLMKRLVQVLVTSEDAARMHLLDVYGNKHK